MILAGVRIAAVVSVGTATIAAAIGAGGLGVYVFRGIATVDSRLILAGAIPAALLALVADGLLARVERSPRPARAAAILAVSLLSLALALFALQRPRAGAPVVVGSKNFTEQVVLGELIAALLEDRGFAVDRRLNLGGTSLCHEAVRAGEIDVYVEYTGTALTDVLKRPVISDRAAVWQQVKDGYQALGLTVGAPLGFNNTFALAMRRDQAEALRIARISDLALRGRDLRVGLFGEFLEREDGYHGLLAAYAFQFTTPPREMDLGLIYRALADGQVDLVVGSATDGPIAAQDLVVLADDRAYFPPYDAVTVANTASLSRHRGLKEALATLEGRLDEAAMRRMNLAVDGEHRAPAAVAREFLAASGLVHRDRARPR